MAGVKCRVGGLGGDGSIEALAGWGHRGRTSL